MSDSNTPGPTTPEPVSPAPDPVSAPIPTDEQLGESTVESLTELPDSRYASNVPAQTYDAFTGLPDAGSVNPFVGQNVDPYTNQATDTPYNPFVAAQSAGTPGGSPTSSNKMESGADPAAARDYDSLPKYDQANEPAVPARPLTPEELAQAVATGSAAPDASGAPAVPAAPAPAAAVNASAPPVEQPPPPLPPVSPFDYSLYVGPGFAWQQYQGAIRDVLDPNNPLWARVTLGVVGLLASPLALAEEYIGRPIANVPFTLQNYGSHIGEYGARSALNFERGETAEGVADALDAVGSASLGFVSAAQAAAPVAGALETRALPTLPASRPTLPAVVEAEAAAPRSTIPVQQLGTIGTTPSRAYFRSLLTRTLQDPSHPLNSILNQQGKLTNSAAKGMNQLTWFENPNIVEAGHYTSAKNLGGAPDRLVMMSAYENRTLSAVLEHPSKGGSMLEGGMVLSIGGVPVDFRTAEALVDAGFLDAEIFADAPLVIYGP